MFLSYEETEIRALILLKLENPNECV